MAVMRKKTFRKRAWNKIRAPFLKRKRIKELQEYSKELESWIRTSKHQIANWKEAIARFGRITSAESPRIEQLHATDRGRARGLAADIRAKVRGAAREDLVQIEKYEAKLALVQKELAKLLAKK